MPFLILSCAAPIPRADCEQRIRELLRPYGKIGGVLIAARASDSDPWIAAVELRAGHDEAVTALQQVLVDGHPIRIRRASALDVQTLTM